MALSGVFNLVCTPLNQAGGRVSIGANPLFQRDGSFIYSVTVEDILDPFASIIEIFKKNSYKPYLLDREDIEGARFVFFVKEGGESPNHYVSFKCAQGLREKIREIYRGVVQGVKKSEGKRTNIDCFVKTPLTNNELVLIRLGDKELQGVQRT